MKSKTFKNSQGFTIIELLIVVVLIAILSGVIMSAINVKTQRDRAEDGVRRANMDKLLQGVESFRAAEGRVPTCSGACTAIGGAAGIENGLSTYISLWPSNFTYVASGTTDFCIYIPLATNSSRYLKYTGTWGQIQECSDISSCTAC